MRHPSNSYAADSTISTQCSQRVLFRRLRKDPLILAGIGVNRYFGDGSGCRSSLGCADVDVGFQSFISRMKHQTWKRLTSTLKLTLAK